MRREAAAPGTGATLQQTANYNTTLSVDDILTRLNKVRPGKKGQSMACCPAHEDRSPSLSIRQAEDGRILLYCFAGCHITDICAAIGIELSDLFPSTERHQYTTLPDWKRKRYEDALFRENLILEIAKSDKAQGRSLSAQDAARVIQAGDRVRKIQGVLNNG